MDAQAIEKQIADLERERTGHIATLQQLEQLRVDATARLNKAQGAIEVCQHWLAKLKADKPQSEAS